MIQNAFAQFERCILLALGRARNTMRALQGCLPHQPQRLEFAPRLASTDLRCIALRQLFHMCRRRTCQTRQQNIAAMINIIQVRVRTVLHYCVCSRVSVYVFVHFVRHVCRRISRLMHVCCASRVFRFTFVSSCVMGCLIARVSSLFTSVFMLC